MHELKQAQRAAETREAVLREALKKMLSSEMDWENGAVGVGYAFRHVAQAALAATDAATAPQEVKS